MGDIAAGFEEAVDGDALFDLPRLVVKETQQVQRAAIVEEDFKPVRISSDPALDGIDVNNMPFPAIGICRSCYLILDAISAIPRINASRTPGS